MNIVLCLNHFMPYQIAGTEVYTWALAKSLQKKGYTVTIVVPNYKSNVFDEYNYDGLLVRRYPEPDYADRLVIMGKKAPYGMGAFEELIRQLNPDIIHLQELAGSSGIGIYHLRLLKKMKVKVVFTMHLARYSCFCGTLMYKDKEPCSGLIDIKRCTQCALSRLPINNMAQQVLFNTSMPLYRANINAGKINHSLGTALSYPFIIKELNNNLSEIFSICEQVIVLTDWYKEVLLKNGVPENKLQLVKQALPYKVMIPDAKNLATTIPIRLIFIGRISAAKGLHLLIEAMRDLPEDKITLDIFGAVNDKKYFEMLKSKTIEKNNICWNEALPQKEVVMTISKYHALVLPSIVGEMSPLVIQEAFAAGVPVIGTNVPGIAEQIEDRKNGMLFKFKDASALKNVLIFLLENPLFIQKLKENIIRPNDFEMVVNQMIAIYGLIITGSRKGKAEAFNR